MFSESYRIAREALTQKMELEAAKHLAKMRIEKATGGGKRNNVGGASAAEEE